MDLEPINGDILETHKKKRKWVRQKEKKLRQKKEVTWTKKNDLDKKNLLINLDQSIEYWLIYNQSNTT